MPANLLTVCWLCARVNQSQVQYFLAERGHIATYCGRAENTWVGKDVFFSPVLVYGDSCPINWAVTVASLGCSHKSTDLFFVEREKRWLVLHVKMTLNFCLDYILSEALITLSVWLLKDLSLNTKWKFDVFIYTGDTSVFLPANTIVSLCCVTNYMVCVFCNFCSAIRAFI